MTRVKRIRPFFFVLCVTVALSAGAQSVVQLPPSPIMVSPGYYPSVVTLPSGDFVVAWQEGAGSYIDGSLVTGGTPGTPFQVSTNSAYYPTSDAAGNANGEFVVVWDNSFSSLIAAQRYNSSGANGGEIAIGGGSGSFFLDPKVDMNDLGQFVVTWERSGYVYFQGFDSTGISVLGPMSIGASLSNYIQPDVALDNSGNFIVAWRDGGYPTYLRGETFNFSGTSLSGGVFPITGGVGMDPSPPSVDTRGGSGFVVAWNEGFYVGKAKRVSAAGDVTAQFADTTGMIGSPIPVASPGNYGQMPRVAANASNFVVTWLDGCCGGYSLYGQAMNNSGGQVGGMFTATSAADWNSVSINDNGTFTVAWNPGTVYGQQFQICAPAVAPTLTAPTNGSSLPETSPVMFSWSNTGADSYTLTYQIDLGTPVVVANIVGTSTSIALTAGAITWSVTSNYLNCPPSAPSATGNFTVTACPVLSPPTLISPPDGGTVESPVTFQWGAVTGATLYELFVGVGTSPSLVGSTASTSLSVPLSTGSGSWYVVAKAGVSCPTASSNTGTFTVKAPFVCPTPTTPTLVAPDDGAEFESGSLVTYEWNATANAVSYQVWGSVNGGAVKLIGATGNTTLTRIIEDGTTEWYVITTFGPGCNTSMTAKRTFKTTTIEPPPPPPPPECGLEDAPLPSVVSEATTGEQYVLRWEQLAGASKYRVQESATDTFGAGIIQQFTTETLQATFSHLDLTEPTPFFYRVAGIPECDEDKLGPYSRVVRVVGLPKPEPSSTNPQVVSEFGNDEFVDTFLFIPGFGSSGKTVSEATFSASSNEAWLTIDPVSGPLPPEGTTIKLTADPKQMGLGANTATVTVTRDDGLGKTTSGSTSSGIPVAVSLVTPVTPIPKTAGPPENALIIPAVANVSGLNSKWFSDVKITNRSGQLINYQLNFSATDQSGIVDGKQTKITIRPGQTVALDDVVRQWYGFGDLADGTNGALEIRPINFTGKTGPEAAPMLATVASSRTYTRAESSLASFGQFIPAVPFSSFLKSGVSGALLMMQQVSQSESLRTNFGIVEGAGKDVNVLLTAYDREGAKLGEFPISLKAGEHKQLNSLLALNGISVQDGRMSVQIVSGDGAVTSYASVVASGTGDPTLVPGVNPKSVSAKKYVLPGVADLRAGGANWRSDVRIFNPNDNAESVNIFFYPQGETTPLGPVEVQIPPGNISVLPGIVNSLFDRQDLGGALHIVPLSGQSTSLVVTGETYDVGELGKYGQFIPAVTEENAIGVGSPGLEIMQVEASSQFRTNLGIAEVTGQAATVQIQLTIPNSLTAPTKMVTLEGNEFQQLNGIVRSMAGGRDVYNGRLTVRVMGGTGKITAYGSTVDNTTNDGTFSAGQ